MATWMWRGEGVLEQYGTGHLIVVADTPEQARELARPKVEENYFDCYAQRGEDGKWVFWDEDMRAKQQQQMAWLEREPEELKPGECLVIQGSE